MNHVKLMSKVTSHERSIKDNVEAKNQIREESRQQVSMVSTLERTQIAALTDKDELNGHMLQSQAAKEKKKNDIDASRGSCTERTDWQLVLCRGPPPARLTLTL